MTDQELAKRIAGDVARCTTHGHLYGVEATCMFCGSPKPQADPVPQIIPAADPTPTPAGSDPWATMADRIKATPSLGDEYRRLIANLDCLRVAVEAGHAEDIRRREHTITLLMGRVEDLKQRAEAAEAEIAQLRAALAEATQR